MPFVQTPIQMGWIQGHRWSASIRSLPSVLTFCLPQRFLPTMEWRKEIMLCREKVFNLAIQQCCILGFFVRHEATKPPRPLSSTLLPHYEQTPFCQALPQAAPCNYSLMPQTGEMGVCYTLHAELRKTTTVGPLFVNQTQGQKTKHYLSHPESITVENCRVEEHCIDLLFVYLFMHFYHISWFVMSFDTVPLSAGCRHHFQPAASLQTRRTF